MFNTSYALIRRVTLYLLLLLATVLGATACLAPSPEPEEKEILTPRVGNIVHLVESVGERKAAEAEAILVGRDTRLGFVTDEKTKTVTLEPTELIDGASLRFSYASLVDHDLPLKLRLETLERATEIELLANSTKWSTYSLTLNQPLVSISAETAGTSGTFAIAEARLVEVQGPNATEGEDYLLWLIDTLRSDYLRSYGGDQRVGSFFKSLEEEAIFASESFSTSAWTRPSTASILTGLYPSFHRANARRSLPPSVNTIAEMMRQAGFTTLAFVTNGNIAAEGLGFSQGFDRFLSIRGVDADPTAAEKAFLDWLSEFPDERVFVYIHTIVPHTPYESPEQIRMQFVDPEYAGPVTIETAKKRTLRKLDLSEPDRQHVRDLYKAAITAQDGYLHAFFNDLEERGNRRRLFSILTSDHGEEFNEHGDWEHGKRLWQEQLEVPLVIVLPSGETRQTPRILGPVQGVDIMPTILSRVGLRTSSPLHGYDLLDASTLPSRVERGIYAEEIRHDSSFALYSLQVGTEKVIVRLDNRGRRRVLFYELAEDPKELNNIWEQLDNQVSLLNRLDAFPKTLAGQPHDQVVEPQFDNSQIEDLEALGYLQK